MATVSNFAAWFAKQQLELNGVACSTPPELPSFKNVREKLKTASDRSVHGDLEEYVYTVPDNYRDLEGLNTLSVTFQFQNPVSAVVETLLDPSIACAETYIWQPTPYAGLYSEFNTGNWWRDAYRRARISELPAHLNYCIMPLTFYTDKAAVGAKENRSVKPISVICNNLVGSVTRTARAQRTIGYWPSLEMTKTAARTTKGILLRRDYFQWIVGKVAASVEKYRHGLRLKLLDGVTRTLIPVWAMGVTDWPEGQEMTNVYQGATSSNRNCRVCRTLTSDFGQTNLGAVGVRRLEAHAMEQTKQAEADAGKFGAVGRLQEKQKEESMYFVRNGWWETERFSNPFGLHSMFPMDILHTVPYGIIKTLKELLVAHAKDGHTVGLLNSRLASLPQVRSARVRGWYYRAFNTGIDSQGKWNAEDYVALLQQMPFVVGHTQDIIKSRGVREAFVQACIAVRILLIVLKMRKVSEDDLAILHEYGAKPLGPAIVNAVGTLALKPNGKEYTTDRPKVHALIHFRYFIRRYGCALNFDSGVWEANHRIVSHETYERDCNRQEHRERRLMEQTNRKAILRLVMEEDVPDPAIRVHALYFQSSRPTIAGKRVYLSNHLRIQAVLDNLSVHLPYNEFNFGAVLKRHFKGPSFKQALNMPVYDVLKEDFGEDKSVYVASMLYRKRAPRHDFVAIKWQGCVVPAELILLFGEGKVWLRGGVENPDQSTHMYALVRKMERARSPAEHLFPAISYLHLLNQRNLSSYEIVHVDTIDGHARVVPDFTPVCRRRRFEDLDSYSFFWWDNVRPEDALAPLLKMLNGDEDEDAPAPQKPRRRKRKR